jgi:predicted HTH domain antitoxin
MPHRTLNVQVKLPTDVVALLAPTQDEAASCLKQLALIELFRRGEISSGYGAELLGITRWDFIKLLGEHGVPYVDMTTEELEQDFEVAKRLFSRRKKP